MNFKKPSMIFWLWVTAATVGYGADNSTVLLHPDRLKALTEIKGKVQAVDDHTRQLTLEDASEQKVTVFVSSDTRVTSSGNQALPWTSLRKGDPVVVYYEPKARLALQIDRQTTTTEGFLGIDPAK